MKHVFIALALCSVALPASADCPPRETISAPGLTFRSGGLVGMINDAMNDCDGHNQASWLAKINETPASNGTPSGLAYCRQIARSKEPQYESQRGDCIYWYGHSIEAP